MNNKEFIAELARRTGVNAREAQQRVRILAQTITETLCEEGTVQVVGFGSFETKKRLERVLVNPTTGQRMLVPPKIVVGFKPSSTIKNKI
ncbi:MAG: HU family DNA-binding protein [Bacteroidaceae bacterium]|nr:HU family DNA-binding protein [Bacteroidaceae bacterium]